MNPLKTLFNKVFDSASPVEGADAVKDEGAFEWNPDEEIVAPTSVRATSWKRGDTPDDVPGPVQGEATTEELATSAHDLPKPTFERTPPPAAEPKVGPVRLWNEPAVPATPRALSTEGIPSGSIKPAASPTPQPWAVAQPWALPQPRNETKPFPSPAPSSESWVKPSLPESPARPPASVVSVPASAPPVLPPSDFEDVYQKAGIKSPIHGYGVERVYRLLTSRRLVGLERSVRRSALLTALDAAGVPASDVSQDAVLRRKALTAFEAEKALELQSLRSRNESRAEALQDTIETFTRQKQSQIERLAQSSTTAVRAQSDLEIRKRMEQDRLHRSLAFFVEPLPSPATEVLVEPAPAARAIETSTVSPDQPRPSADEVPAAPGQTEEIQTREIQPMVAETPNPSSPTGLEVAVRTAAEEAGTEGWGRTSMVENSPGDAADALRNLREGKKTDSES